MIKKILQIILGVAVIGLLMGLVTAHLINFGFFTQWEFVSLPPNMVGQHLSVQSDPLRIKIETISQDKLSLVLDYSTMALVTQQPHSKSYGHCQTESLLDNYYVAEPPSRVVEQWDCRLLEAGDWGRTYRVALLEQGEVWYWRASSDVGKVIVYVTLGSLGLIPGLLFFIGYSFVQIYNKFTAKKSSSSLSPTQKLSIKDPQFLQPLENYLKQKPLVVWHQLAWAGGLQEWFLVTTSVGLQQVLSTGQRASAFTAYEWLPHPQPYVVNEHWAAEMSQVIQKDVPNHFILIMPTPTEQNTPGFYPLKWLYDSEDLQDYLAEHQGENVIVGHTPHVQNGEIKRGYMPNQDGIPESGPY